METIIIKRDIDYKNIGGQNFVIDSDASKKLTPESIYNRAMGGNMICQAFLSRRKDFDIDFPYNLYYGKVGILGYIIAEDEFEGYDSNNILGL